MGEFFKGWRRKAGLVTLAMACLLTCAWMRSYMIRECVCIPRRSSDHNIESHGGGLHWYRDTPSIGNGGIRWHSESLSTPLISGGIGISPISLRRLIGKAEWGWRWAGFDFGVVIIEGRISSVRRSDFCIVPYWSLVLPLTLLSAWLILVTPRNEKRTQAPIDSRSQEGQ